MTRRELVATAAASLAGFGLGAKAAVAGTKTLRFIAQSDLRVLDPIWMTAGNTRNHGYMVYDTLFALDPQIPAAAADGGRLRYLRGPATLQL
jgi:peptide/nickel transport system substrate-binding protein